MQNHINLKPKKIKYMYHPDKYCYENEKKIAKEIT